MHIDIDWRGQARTVDITDMVRRVDGGVAGGPVAVAVTDLDRFGELLDTKGQEAAKNAVQVWVDTLVGSLPADAIVGRLGGDEFALALPDTSAENAVIMLDEIRSHIAGHPVDGWTISATFGIAARPTHATGTEDLFRCAAEALARGKREGGNRVAIYVEEKMVLKSNYYSRGSLDRLSKVAGRLNRTEASLLREALDDLFQKLR